MAGTLISKIVNGEDNSTSFTNLQQSMLMLMRSHDGMTFGNFVKGNTAMLNVLAQSSVSVNYNVYKWTVAETILFLAANGSTSSMDSAVAAEYLLIAVVDAESQCTIYARRASEIIGAGNETYGGWYVNGTQNRILGGFTKNSDGTYTRKWRYKPYGFRSGDPGNLYSREYADGLASNLYVCTTAKNVYALGVLTGFVTTETVTTDVTITHPCKLWLNITGHSIFTHPGISSAKPAAVSLFCDIIYLDTDCTELDVMQTTTVTFPARSNSTSAGAGETVTRNRLLDVTPGRYRLKFYNGAYVTGNLVVNYPETNTILAYTRDEICNTDTTF